MPSLGFMDKIKLSLEITASTSKLRAGLVEASSLIRDWSLVTTGLTAGVTNAFKTIASVGIKAVTVALAGLVGVFAMVAKSGADFEDNMLRAFVIMQESSGATARDFKNLTDTAIRMGSETLFSANEAAEGLQILARAGFSAKEAITSIKPVVDLAIIGNMSLAETSNVAVAAMYGFGLGAEDMSRVSDVLAVASSQANTTVALLGSSLSFVAPVARAAGLSIEETSAALGILSNAGIRGSRAGTTLRRALSVLLAPTGRAKKIFKELGLTFTDSSGKLESFSTILKKLEGASLTAAQTMEIFGLRAGPGMAALLASGTSALDTMTERLEGAQGAADRMSQEFRTTVKGRVRDLGASIINLGLAFSEKFKKPLSDTIFAIRNYVKGITEALQKTGTFKAIVNGVISALSPLTRKIVELAKEFKKMLEGLTKTDIANFFDRIKERVQSFITLVSSDVFKRNVIAVFKGIKAVVMGFVNSLLILGKIFMSLPASIQPFVAQIATIAITFSTLMGGITNIILLLITLKFVLPVVASQFKGLGKAIGFVNAMLIGGTARTGAWATASAKLVKIFGPLATLFVGISASTLAIVAGIVAVVALVTIWLHKIGAIDFALKVMVKSFEFVFHWLKVAIVYTKLWSDEHPKIVGWLETMINPLKAIANYYKVIIRLVMWYVGLIDKITPGNLTAKFEAIGESIKNAFDKTIVTDFQKEMLKTDWEKAFGKKEGKDKTEGLQNITSSPQSAIGKTITNGVSMEMLGNLQTSGEKVNPKTKEEIATKVAELAEANKNYLASLKVINKPGQGLSDRDLDRSAPSGTNLLTNDAIKAVDYFTESLRELPRIITDMDLADANKMSPDTLTNRIDLLPKEKVDEASSWLWNGIRVGVESMGILRINSKPDETVTGGVAGNLTSDALGGGTEMLGTGTGGELSTVAADAIAVQDMADKLTKTPKTSKEVIDKIATAVGDTGKALTTLADMDVYNQTQLDVINKKLYGLEAGLQRVSRLKKGEVDAEAGSDPSAGADTGGLSQ